MAAKLKTRGNTAYTSRKFEIAAELYTQAIAVSPKDEPVFYSNRAACKPVDAQLSTVPVSYLSTACRLREHVAAEARPRHRRL